MTTSTIPIELRTYDGSLCRAWELAEKTCETAHGPGTLRPSPLRYGTGFAVVYTSIATMTILVGAGESLLDALTDLEAKAARAIEVTRINRKEAPRASAKVSAETSEGATS